MKSEWKPPRARIRGIELQLHVRVPSGINLSAITIPRGNIGVYGRVGSVTANIAESGNISLFGASGDINLSTGQGSIAVPLTPGNNNVTARAGGGNVDIVAVTAAVDVATSNGNVRFIGTLRNDRRHTVVITGNGNIDLALPAYSPGQTSAQPYRIYSTTSANPIITDYPPTVTVGGNSSALTICGFVYSNGPYDYHIENTPVRHFGRIEISSALTETFFFSGTLGTDYYRFDTNRPNVRIHAPCPAEHPYLHLGAVESIQGRQGFDRCRLQGSAEFPGRRSHCPASENSPWPRVHSAHLHKERVISIRLHVMPECTLRVGHPLWIPANYRGNDSVAKMRARPARVAHPVFRICQNRRADFYIRPLQAPSCPSARFASGIHSGFPPTTAGMTA